MPLSSDNYRDMCAARDAWHTKFSGHLRQAVQGATARHKHFYQHQAYSTPVNKEEVEKAIKTLEEIFGRNRSGHCWSAFNTSADKIF